MQTRTLSVGQKAGWGLADMGIVVFVIVKQLLVLSFLTNYLNVPVGIAGVLTTSVLIFDIITDPIVGYLSDRTHSRWGRRVPWMVIGALILSGGIIGLFGVPQSLSLLGTIIWVGGFFALATVGFTMVAIPYGATAGEMTQDPKERSTNDGFQNGFCKCRDIAWWCGNSTARRRYTRWSFYSSNIRCSNYNFIHLGILMVNSYSTKDIIALGSGIYVNMAIGF